MILLLKYFRIPWCNSNSCHVLFYVNVIAGASWRTWYWVQTQHLIRSVHIFWNSASTSTRLICCSVVKSVTILNCSSWLYHSRACHSQSFNNIQMEDLIREDEFDTTATNWINRPPLNKLANSQQKSDIRMDTKSLLISRIKLLERKVLSHDANVFFKNSQMHLKQFFVYLNLLKFLCFSYMCEVFCLNNSFI